MSGPGLRDELGPATVHLCIDMQNLFGAGSPWETPWMERVLPQVEQLADRWPRRTVFTSFQPPHRASDRQGSWRRLFTTWREVTRECADPRWMELLPSLARRVPPAALLPKRHYSPFFRTPLRRWLAARQVETLVISGAETDICVLATVLDAVDYGFRTVIAEDAICSSSDATHDALLTLYRERFSHQVELADTRTILEYWRH